MHCYVPVVEMASSAIFGDFRIKIKYNEQLKT